MKDMLENLFHKPKVLFILMLICLSPFIRTIQACLPPDCSAEAAAFASAHAALHDAQIRLAEAEAEYESAKEEVEGKETALKMAYAYLAASWLLAEEACRTGGALLCASALANVLVAELAVAQCTNSLADAWDRLGEAIEELHAATNAAITAYLNLIQAWRDYQDCISGG